MPKLNCGVENCAYNAERCCCLGSIDVDGSHSTSCTEGTCCNSFVEDDGAHNCSGVPEANSEVACKAVSCMHNENAKCNANSIDVAGNGASNSIETECSTFASR